MHTAHAPRLRATNAPVDTAPIPDCRRCGNQRDSAPTRNGQTNPYCADCRTAIRHDPGYLARLPEKDRERVLAWVTIKPRGLHQNRATANA